ncbi:MAG: hypothetical protein ACTHMP_14400 [Thermomicrobiales bacterium]
MRRLVALLVVPILLALVVPSQGLALAGVSAASATLTPCVYSNGSFTGDCDFYDDPSSVYTCNWDANTHTYSLGCRVVDQATDPNNPSNQTSGSPTPTPVPGVGPSAGVIRRGTGTPPPNGQGCEVWMDSGVQQWSCYIPYGAVPSVQAPNPAPGYFCTYDPLNENYSCKTPGPPASQNCTYNAANENYTCAPINPPPPTVPSCSAGNLLCNGDFSVPTGPADGVGGWQYSSTAVANHQYVGYNHGSYSGRDVQEFQEFCGSQFASCSNHVQQSVTAPASGRFHLEWDQAAMPPYTYSGYPNGSGDIYISFAVGGGTGTFSIAGNNITCTRDGGAYTSYEVYTSGWHHIACDSTGTVAQNTTMVFQFNSGGNYDHGAISNVLAYMVGSPPAPGGVAGADSGNLGPDSFGFTCDSTGTTCAKPPAPAPNPQAAACTYDAANENYICPGPPPPGGGGGLAIPTVTTTPTSAPFASGTPGPGNIPGVTAGGCDFGSVFDLSGHAAFIGCEFDGLENMLYGVGLAFAVAGQFALDVGRLGLLALGGVAGIFGHVFAGVGFLWDFSTGWLGALTGALSTPAAPMTGADKWRQFVGAIPGMDVFLTGCAALLWLRVGMWVVREASRLANG